MRKITTILAIISAGFLVTPVMAKVTLGECIAEVVKTHPRALEKLKAYNAIVYDREAVNSAQNFTLNVQSDLGHQDISNSSTRYRQRGSDVSSARIVARKLLTDGGKIRFETDSKEAGARSALFSYIDTANILAYEAADAYISVLKARELLRLAVENVEIHSRLQQSIRSRVEAGTSGKSELERIQGRLASAQAGLIVRQNEYKKSIYQLHKVMGRFVDGNELEYPIVPGQLMPNSLSLALKKQWEKHPMLIAADYNIDVKNIEYNRERVSTRPNLFLEASRDWRRNFSGIRGEDNDASLMLRLSFPLYDGGTRRHRMNQYKSLVHREKHIRDNIGRTLLNDLQLTYTGYKLLDAQIGAMRKSIFFTRQALRSYQHEFKLGKRLLINILDAEVEYQNAKAQLESLRSDLTNSQFRLLYSMGALAEDLGIEIPLAKELAEARRSRPASKDELPYSDDFDGDGIADKVDVSVNSLKDQVLNDFGETQEMTLAWLEEPVKESLSSELQAIKDKADLQLQGIKPDVPAELAFVSFEKNTKELSPEAKVLMRELLPQLKKFASDGLIKIAVTHGDAAEKQDQYLLALQRAYNIKKIMVMHMFDPAGVNVESRAPKGSEKPNAMVITVQTSSDNFCDFIETVSEPGLKFHGISEEISPGAEILLKRFAERFSKYPEAKLDVVVYNNDDSNATNNRLMALRRAEKIKTALIEMGLDSARIFEIGWGDYDDSLDLYNAMGDIPGANKVELVIRQ